MTKTIELRYIWLFLMMGFAAPAVAQDPLLEQFKLFAANTTRERVFLHLNQHYVQAGDRIWFQGYIFDDGQQTLSDASKVLYVNVVDGSGQVIVDEKVPLLEGRGEGYLDIPDQLAKGVYMVRAYTGWMRNFEPEHFFRDWLWVNLQPSAISVKQQNNEYTKLSLRIIPEGNLQPVAGLTTRYAVEARTPEGYGAKVEANVLDDEGKIAASFTTNKFGYGAFILQPKRNRTYQVVLPSRNAQKQVHPFPAVQDEGMSLLLTALPSYLRVSFQSNWTSRTDHRYRLLLQSKGTIFLDQVLDFNSQAAQVLNLPLQQLRQGIYQMLVLNGQGKVEAERIFQVYPTFNSPPVELSAENAARRQRLQVELSGSQTVAYSVSVSDKMLEGSYEAVSPAELFYMHDVLTADPTELFYFQDREFRRPENWDLFLMTKTHPAYEWEKVSKYQLSYPKWPYEKFISAYGQVRNADSLLLGQDQFTFYSFAHSEVIPARTDDYGWFLLPLFDFYGPTNVIGLADQKEVSFAGLRIDVERGLPDPGIEVDLIKRLQQNQTFPDLTRNKLIFKSSYRKLVPALYPEPEQEELPKEFKPVTRNSDDYMLDLREYLSFSSLREVFIEIGRGIIVRERGGKKVIIMYDPLSSQAFPEPALIFINGIPTIDYELVLTLDPDIIETIQLYRSATAQERFGAMGRNGILSIVTKAGALEIPKQENITFTFEGFQYKQEFSNATVQKENLPDLRHQLYWRSGREMPGRIEFTTSDILSNFELRMISYGADGQWNLTTKSFGTLPEVRAEE